MKKKKKNNHDDIDDENSLKEERNEQINKAKKIDSKIQLSQMYSHPDFLLNK